MVLKVFVVILVVVSAVIAQVDIDPTLFLKKYGYLHENNIVYAVQIHESLQKMQRFAHISVTGVVDEQTVKMMNSPRCGRPDYESTSSFFAYRKWTKTDLTYHFENHTPDLSLNETERIIAEAFQVWADVTPLRFFKVQSGGDFSIVFGRRRHVGGRNSRGTCNAAFDGKGRVLAHAYFPPDGRAHFDEDETFTYKTRSGINLFWVAAHEFGHALGLSHSRKRSALMYPYYGGYIRDFTLPLDDIQRIQNLYGPGSTLAPGETYPSRTTQFTPPHTTLPLECFDKNGEAFCKARISVCTTDHTGWLDFMKRNCYKTCFCGGPATLLPTGYTPKATLSSTTSKPMTNEPSKATSKQTTYATISPSTKPVQTKATAVKPTGPECVDKAGRYCKGHAKRCGTNDPTWKSYLQKNCFKTCFC